MYNYIGNYQVEYDKTKVVLREAFSRFKEKDRLKVKKERRADLTKILESSTSLYIDLNNNMLTLAESIIIALSAMYSTSEISYMLTMKKETVKSYVSRVKEKLNARSKTHAICIALRNNIFVIK